MKNIFPGIAVAAILVAIICLTPSRLFESIRGHSNSTSTRDHAGIAIPALPEIETPAINLSTRQFSYFYEEDRKAKQPHTVVVAQTSPVLTIATDSSPETTLGPTARPLPASTLTPEIASAAKSMPAGRSSTAVMPLEPIPDTALMTMSRPASIEDYISERDIIKSALPKTRVMNIPAPVSTKQGGGTFSSSAFASLTEGVALKAVCPTSVCSDPPPKGITARIYGKSFQEEQKADWSKGYASAYKTKGTMAGAGFLKDWSIATTVGLSADYLNADVESKWDNDQRKNNVSGYIFNAHLQTSFMDKFPVEGKLMYGHLNTTGNGSWSADDIPALDTTWGWKEDKHRSKLFGFSGKIGVPLVFGDDIKLEPDAGFQLLRLQTDPYNASLFGYGDTWDVGVDKTSSTSLSVPIMLDLKKETTQCFGTFTPRLSFGLIKEFSDTAMGVRSFNTAAASRFINGRISEIDDGPRTFYKVGAGMSLTTVGGWSVKGDYSYYWNGSDKYKNIIFTVEAARCF